MREFRQSSTKAQPTWLHTALQILFVFTLSGPAASQTKLQTPLEMANFTRISQSAEITAYLKALTGTTALAHIETLGYSVQGRPIEALIVSRQKVTGSDDDPRMTLMIVGTQHGAAEPAGGEALLVIARDLVSDSLNKGSLNKVLDTTDIILVPNANPDGRDLHRRSNANRVNINTDFVLVTQPETQALVQALQRYHPDVLLDTHESAILKRQTLAKEGYLTDFDAQFETANHPAVPGETRRYMADKLLPPLTSRVTEAGLPAQHYIGEITSIKQPITNGGLTAQNFRNTAGLTGALSFLVETKLDSRDDTFPTYRNIAVRVERQLICIRSFISLMHEKQQELLVAVANSRRAMQSEPVSLQARYSSDPAHPFVDIPLRKLDTRQREILKFRDFRRVETAYEMPVPKYLALTSQWQTLKPILDRHLIRSEVLTTPRRAQISAHYGVSSTAVIQPPSPEDSRTKMLELPAGTLMIDLAQTNGRLGMLLLDPRSNSSVFKFPEFAKLLQEKHEFFIYSVF